MKPVGLQVLICGCVLGIVGAVGAYIYYDYNPPCYKYGPEYEVLVTTPCGDGCWVSTPATQRDCLERSP